MIIRNIVWVMFAIIRNNDDSYNVMTKELICNDWISTKINTCINK